MKRSTRSFPPPTDAAGRYDAVLRRGTSLRRRARLAKGAGAGGAALAVLLIAVLVVGRGGSNDQVVVNESTTSTTTTTAPDPIMGVKVMADANDVAVKVTDPDQPIDPRSKICVQVSITDVGPAQVPVAEGFTCWQQAEGEATTEEDLQLTNGAAVGCSATAERPDPSAPTAAPQTAPVEHTFNLAIPDGVPKGHYEAQVIGVSGVGSGCLDQTPGNPDHSAQASDQFQTP